MAALGTVIGEPRLVVVTHGPISTGEGMVAWSQGSGWEDAPGQVPNMVETRLIAPFRPAVAVPDRTTSSGPNVSTTMLAVRFWKN